MNNKNVITSNIIIIYLLSFFVTGNSFGQEKSNNAAILYYQAFLLCPDRDSFSDEFIKFGYGSIDTTPELLQFNIVTNKNLIQLFSRGTDIQQCEWLIQNQDIGNEIIPQIKKRIQALIPLIGADTRCCAINGDYIAAFDKCDTLLRFTKHIELLDRDYFLITEVINRTAFNCIGKILDIMPPNENNLTYVKNILTEEGNDIPQLFERIMYEQLESLMEKVSDIDIKESIEEQPIKDTNYESYKKELLSMKNKDIVKLIHQELENYLNSIFETISKDNSYNQTYTKIQDIEKEYKKRLENNPAITRGIKPAIEGFTQTISTLYTHNIRYISQFYSLKNAVDIYLIKARIGQLPKELPKGLAKDPYSGHDFEYILTSDGFKLCCKEKDINTKKYFEFEFKVK